MSTRSVFICHDRHSDAPLVRVVLEAVANAGFEPVLGAENAGSADVAAETLAAIARADLVVAVLDQPGANVAFELGYAIGAGKAVVVVTEPRVEVPTSLI